MAVAELAAALAAQAKLAVPPLVCPLVTPVLWSQPPDDYLARGVLVCQEGHWKVHAEIMDITNTAVPLEEWQSTAISWALEKEFEFATWPFRPGDPCSGRPAVHCQADSITSVAAEIRDGQLLERLMRSLYAESPRFWTLRGINIGAGIDQYPLCEGNNTYCNQDDPLDLWQSTEAKQLVLIDGDDYRLQQAVKKARAKRSNKEDLELVTLNRVLTPLDLEAGLLDELFSSFDHEVDILKIDVDSYDCALLQVLLSKVKTYVLVMESQPLIPPPFKFARGFNSRDPLEQGLVGCSLSYQLQLLRPDYELLVFSEHDTVFVHRELLADLEMMPPGQIFPWTLYPLRFPVDEWDCFRRARFLHLSDAAERSLGEETGQHRLTPKPIPLDFMREWLDGSMPMTTIEQMWRNITTVDGEDASLLQDVRYILDL